MPIEHFARTPQFSQLQLSLGGSRIAYVREIRGQRRLYVAELSKLDHPEEVPLGETVSGTGRKEVAGYTWISDERLLITTAVSNVQLYGAFAINWNGQQRVALSGHELPDRSSIRFFATEPLYTFDDAGGSILMLNDRTRFGDPTLYPDVMRVDTRTGGVSPVVKNPGNVVAWGVDFSGAVRIGITSTPGDGTSLQLGAIFRESASAPWQTLFEPAPVNDRIRPLDFEAGGSRILVAVWSPAQRTAVHQYDPRTRELGAELVSDPEYDVVPDAYVPSFAGIGLGDFVGSWQKGGVVGVRYCTDRIALRWLDDEYRTRQARIDELLPETVNIVCGATRDEAVFLVLAFSDRHPGAYLVFDERSRSVRLLGERMGWLPREGLAPMRPISYVARDGLRIHGYLTLPIGVAPRGLPLVVIPHGGPAARDIWGFDPFVQMLASRGYAVFQPNFRGSTGYGRAFFELGRRQVGGKIQEDIEDASRWAVTSGVADPARMAIVGVSFGGYSALYALGHSPGLYRCGVSVAGVADWMGIFEEGARRPELALARAHWTDQIGDPAGEEARLRAASPVNFADRIAAPLLLIHGRDDRNVPVQQTRELASRLKKLGRDPEVLLLQNEGHTFADEQSRHRAFTRMLEFLARHLRGDT